ncbi:MAG: universal stress protein [Rhodospirillaceae bacterium]
MSQPIILAAVDLGPHSRNVIERALSQAAAHDASVTVIYCASAPVEEAEAALRALLAGSEGGEGIAARIVSGDPATAIIAEAEAVDARMIVVGASDRSFLEQVFRGSVTLALIRSSRRPILVARTAVLADYHQVLMAVDVNGPVAPLAAAVRSILGPVPAELFTVLDDAVRVQMIVAQAKPDDVAAYEKEAVHSAYKVLTTAAGQVAEPGWAPSARVAAGNPLREILNRLEELGGDVLVLQPEAKGAFLRALLGSLTEELLARSRDCDLLIVPE